MTGKSPSTEKRREKPEKPKDSSLNGSFHTFHSSWLKQSVQEFFSHCNWQGQTIELQDLQQDGQPLPLTASVAEFFRAVPWEGNPTVGSLPKSSSNVSPVAPPDVPQTTLADLVDLF